MKIFSKYLASIIIVALCSVFAFADVAPDPGYRRISLKLIVESSEDLSEYRFFIVSGDKVKEVDLKKGEQATVAQLGGGARYNSGKFVAVQKKGLVGLSEPQSGILLDEMQKAPHDRKVAGIVELVKHSFSREVRDVEASSWHDPVYRIEKDPQTSLKAVLVSGGSNVSNGSTNVSNSGANVKKINNVASSGLTF